MAMKPRLDHFFLEDFDAAEVVVIEEEPPPPPEPEPEPPELVPYFTEQELETARRDAYAAGQADTAARTLAAHEAAVGASLAALERALADAADVAEAVAEEAAELLARLLLRSLATLLPGMCARHGAAEIETVLRWVLPKVKSEPRILLHVHPTLTEAIRARLETLAPELVARISLEPDAAVAEGDVQIAWHNGAAVRDSAALQREMAEVLGQLGLLHDADDGPVNDERLTRENANVE